MSECTHPNGGEFVANTTDDQGNACAVYRCKDCGQLYEVRV